VITEELILYLKNSLVTDGRIQAETRDENNVPMPGRNLFVSLKSHASKFFERGTQPRMIAISGLRGVGKTTLMWQIAETVFQNQTKKIFFISVDDLNRLGANLFEAFQVLEQHVFKKPLPELEEPVMFLIDEVHEAPEWDKDLKILYEKCKRAFILCTGSSALLLHKSPDLATRWTLVKLFPFRFSEFILAKSWADNPKKQLFPAKGLGSELRNTLLYSEEVGKLSSGLKKLEKKITVYFSEIKKRFGTIDLNSLIDEYISYHNIARFLKIENKELINERIIGLFERIILKDIPEFTSAEDAARMQRLLMRLALSDEINFQKLSKEFRCSENEIETLIDTLDKAEILNVFHPYGGVKSKTGQSRKAFFMSPSLRRALYSRIFGPKLEDNLRAKLYEDAVAMYLRKSVDSGLLSFGQARGSKTPDFIVETRERPIVIEVGSYKTKTTQVSKYEKNKRYGLVISARETDLIVKDEAVIIPLSWFLLL
jgi:hypothetical protein